jgi:predicted acylesterase/phospholipase RssA
LSTRLISLPLTASAGLMILTICGHPASADTQTVGLVISGGVSEGAYQAGATYAFMKFLLERRAFDQSPKDVQKKHHFGAQLAGRPNQTCGLASAATPSLDVAAGSSAGNINAFLAGLTWCEDDGKRFRPRENLFWDGWINVGWNGLSPEVTDEAKYVRQFDDPMSVGEYRNIEPQALRPWRRGTSVYSGEDGLVTRNAFVVGFASLARRMRTGKFRPGCQVRIGLTATRDEPGKLTLGDYEVRAQRFVAPLSLESRAGFTPAVVVKNLDLTPKQLAPAGLSLALPLAEGERDGAVTFGSLVKLIKASSAFPLAFAPVPMDYCLRGQQTGTPSTTPGLRCPGDNRPVMQARFMDGGILDNQPFGLAEILAEHAVRDDREAKGASPEAAVLKPKHTLFFIDVSPVRSPITAPKPVRKQNGVTLLLDILEQRVNQVRGYENLGFARGHRDVQVRTSSRFFPIVANQLTASFGAFMHPSFRVHDYFVGVYDGIYWVAQSLEQGDRCNGGGDGDGSDQVLSSDRARPSAATFMKVAHLLIGDDAGLLTFVRNLFAYEQHWTGNPGDITMRDFCRPPPPPRTKPGPWREDERVWQVFQALCETDQKSRRLARQGASAALAHHLKEADNFHGLVRRLPSDFLGDVDRWNYATADRLVRRAIDVERSDRRLGHSSRLAETGALMGRLALVSMMERDPEVLDLDPSSVARVSAQRWSIARTFWHLFPSTLVWDPVQSRAMAGYEPKLRFGTSRWFMPFALLGEWYPYHPTFHPDAFGLTTHLGGVGWDPSGRIVDDVGLALSVAWDFPLDAGPRAYGLELATQVLGSKLRLALGVPQFFASGGQAHSPLFTRARLDGFYVSVGFGDLNGSLAWLSRSVAGYLFPQRCEADCDGPPLPEPDFR